jgi:hypothetical protein
MALLKDMINSVVVVDLERMVSRTSAGSYTQGAKKNMRRKEGGFLVIVEVDAINTNLLLKFSQALTNGGTYTDIASGTLVPLPGPGEFANPGTVTAAAGVQTITAIGKYAMQLSSDLYERWLTANWQTTGGACSFSITLVATGAELPISS